MHNSSFNPSPDFESWDHDALFGTPCASISEELDIENILNGDKGLDADFMTVEIGKLYSEMATTFVPQPLNQDQDSRFTESVKRSNKRLLVPKSNIKYKYSLDEKTYLEQNYDKWMNKLKHLGITDPLDVAFVTRPDFIDVMSQIMGNAMRGSLPTINTTHEFKMRRPPSLIEKVILEGKKNIPHETEDKVKKLYETYQPMVEDRVNKTLEYIGKKGTLTVNYPDYKTRENYIRKHILNHFKTSRHIAVALTREMKVYDVKLKYYKKMPISMQDFRIPELMSLFLEKEKRTNYELYREYRMKYLTHKCHSRLDDMKNTVYGQFSLTHRSTYYRYERFVDNYVKNTSNTLLIITEDKTINDIAFRIFFVCGKFKKITIQGDFNFLRVGKKAFSTFKTGKYVTYAASCLPSRAEVNYDDYDFIIVDTMNLSLMRNSIVYGDYQQSQMAFNAVTSRKSKAVIVWRSGAADYFHDKCSVNIAGYRIIDAYHFKATSPECILLVQMTNGYNEVANEIFFRNILIYKLSLIDDLIKIFGRGYTYYVKPYDGPFIQDDILLTDTPTFTYLHGKKANYVNYSKTRQTKRFQIREGADIVQTYLADTNLKTALTIRNLKNMKPHDRGILGMGSTMFLSRRSIKIVDSLVRNDYDITEALCDLNSVGTNSYNYTEVMMVINQLLIMPTDEDSSTIRNAILHTIKHDVSEAKFHSSYPGIASHEFERYFKVEEGLVRFRGIVGPTQEDLDDPITFDMMGLKELEHPIKETEKSIYHMEQYDPISNFNPSSPSYNPVSPLYNPVSPDYNPVSATSVEEEHI